MACMRFDLCHPYIDCLLMVLCVVCSFCSDQVHKPPYCSSVVGIDENLLCITTSNLHVAYSSLLSNCGEIPTQELTETFNPQTAPYLMVIFLFRIDGPSSIGIELCAWRECTGHNALVLVCNNGKCLWIVAEDVNIGV